MVDQWGTLSVMLGVIRTADLLSLGLGTICVLLAIFVGPCVIVWIEGRDLDDDD